MGPRTGLTKHRLLGGSPGEQHPDRGLDLGPGPGHATRPGEVEPTTGAVPSLERHHHGVRADRQSSENSMPCLVYRDPVQEFGRRPGLGLARHLQEVVESERPTGLRAIRRASAASCSSEVGLSPPPLRRRRHAEDRHGRLRHPPGRADEPELVLARRRSGQ